MSCCPEAPQINTTDASADEPSIGAIPERRPGETEDCYAKRVGNTSQTGQVDDKTEEVPDKIANNSVTTDPAGAVNIQFRMTRGSSTTVDNWSFNPAGFPGVTANTATGLLSGTFQPAQHNQRLTLRVQARQGSLVIDDRTYAFAPAGGDGEDTIQLQHPLPGSVQTSGYGPRRPPATGASDWHRALDFAYPGGVTKDVLCAYDGEVVLARPGIGYGNYVLVKHFNAAGTHLITTCYAHLDSIYVRVGQKVIGGQALGKEGNTGIGSGPHLHFEVRLPNDTRVDPTPYLRGTVTVANNVTRNNQPDVTAGTSTVTSNSRITPAGVSAAEGCEAFGPSYPVPAAPDVAPPPVNNLPPAVGDDPFEKAWYFTMKQEVNSLWMTTPPRSPSDSEVGAGLISNPSQRERVGWVDHPKDPGGKTKFGVAQRFNPSIAIETMNYAQARSTGYNTYWLSTPSCAAMASVKIACMVFDIKYATGTGGTTAIMQLAGVTGAETGATELAACRALRDARLKYLQSKPGWSTFGRGWTRRANESLEYALSL